MTKNEIVVVGKEELKELIEEAVKSSLSGLNLAERVNLPEEVEQEEVREEIEETEAPNQEVDSSEEVVEDEDDMEEEEVEVDEFEAIKQLSYNDLKKKAKEIGVSAVGKRDVILERILEALQGSENEETEEETNYPTEEVEAPENSSQDDIEPSEDEEDTEEEFIDSEVVEKQENSTEEISYEWDEEQAKEIRELMNSLTKKQILEIADRMDEGEPLNYNKKKFIDYLMIVKPDLLRALEELGYIESANSQDAEDEDEEVVDADYEEADEVDEELVQLAEDLAEWDLEDLADVCSEQGLSTKGNKQSLIDRIVKAYEEGEILESDLFEMEDEEAPEDAETEDTSEDYEEEWYTQEELEEMSDEELEEIAEEEDLEIPTKKIKKGRKRVSVLDREALIEAILDLAEYEEDYEEDYEDDEEDTEDENELSDELLEQRAEVEDEVEDGIRTAYKNKKLKDTTIKNFLITYNEGNPDFDPKSLKKEESLEEYIRIHRALVDDNCEVCEQGDVYLRDNKDYCCGKPLSKNGKTYYCSVCGTEYED